MSGRAWRWLVGLTAGATGGSLSIVAWWAALPVELRALVASAIGGLFVELWQVVKAALKLRAARALGVPQAAVEPAPGAAPAAAVPDLEQPQPQHQAQADPAEVDDVHEG